ncbi:MAG: family 10 glycosylhydrolase [Clostridia bacterium]|nr:family 10 glycosylhydrolase [Clostridia bacterium]
MKRFVSLLLVLMLLSGCSSRAVQQSETTTHSDAEIRAVWISYLDWKQFFRESEDDYSASVRETMLRIKDALFNTVFLHVRAFSDAFYPSELFPFSACITGAEGKNLGFDPLLLFCREAEKAGVSVHAWINPFRIGSKKDFAQKAEKNPAVAILHDEDPDNDHCVVCVDDMLYYDPASSWVHDLNLRSIRELLEHYPIDGIHIDDYFYPGTDPEIDQTEYAAYTSQGGSMDLDDWRRAEINAFVSAVYMTIKQYGDEKVFSISPAVRINRNFDTLYADVARWGAVEGYCDWLIPQVYVGFLHETLPFRDAVTQWNDLVRCDSVRILYGLAAYKCGQEDAYAGTGSNEWIDNKDILSEQIEYSRTMPRYDGFALFSYSSVFDRKDLFNLNSEK